MAEEMLHSKMKLKKSKRSFVNLETLDDDDQSQTEADEDDKMTINSTATLK